MCVGERQSEVEEKMRREDWQVVVEAPVFLRDLNLGSIE